MFGMQWVGGHLCGQGLSCAAPAQDIEISQHLGPQMVGLSSCLLPIVPSSDLRGLPWQVLRELHPPVPVSQGAVPGSQPHWFPAHL